MPWTNKQKSTAVQACRAAGITDEHRKLLLRQFGNAMYDAQGERSDEPSSTSKRLTNSDFEGFMAVVERFAGGRLPKFTSGYWATKAGDRVSRLRFKVRELAVELEALGLLQPGVGLAGWIQKRVTKGEARELAELDYHDLLTLITQLSAYQRQKRVGAA